MKIQILFSGEKYFRMSSAAILQRVLNGNKVALILKFIAPDKALFFNFEVLIYTQCL